MACHPLSWLLGWAVLCHLITLLAGQHHAVNKCSTTCNKMTSKIPVNLLSSYNRTEASCPIPAVILRTVKNRTFCADPEERWVREAMEHLDRKKAPSFGRQTRPKPTEGSRSPEAHRSSGAGPEPPTGEAVSSFPTASQAPNGGPSAGHERTEPSEPTAATAVTTAMSWQGSYQPEVDLSAGGKASGAPSTQSPSILISSQTPSILISSTQTLPTQAPGAPSTQTPSILISTQTPSILISSTQALHTQDPSTQDPSTQALPTQAPFTQTSSTETPSAETPSTSMEPVVSGNRAPKPEDPQRLDITPVPDPQASTRRQAVGLLAFLGLLFCLGVGLFAYQSLQGCPRGGAGDMVEGFRYIPRSCGSNSYILVPV